MIEYRLLKVEICFSMTQCIKIAYDKVKDVILIYNKYIFKKYSSATCIRFKFKFLYISNRLVYSNKEKRENFKYPSDRCLI